MKFFGQKRFGICGAVAVGNAIVWAGGKQPKITALDKECRGKNRDGGTPTHKISKLLLKNYKLIRYKLQSQPSITQISRHIKKQGAVLLQFVWEDSLSGHYCLIVDSVAHSDKGMQYTIVNWNEAEVVKSVSKEELEKVLKVSMYGAPRAWLLSRKTWLP